ncbi:MAG: hypothetical protein A2843_00820 [Candidatus Wildermuthbacteria bacterium RIFCSPHIGHO2_01_FULL_48_27b]|uniref:Uncharacterized protein n=1 Tax=Candidatus Wildermuthbacteria bacterium RIFCSPHIGHO2_01_FULL_48_27b TaxID=1802447 RepID=A0A1G2QX24_9BACT|nr:MAG: hypothetical protein A2843_00820 [Candidatus Wildermuthbacteria bacterium RIFCSPHIGHO2_01_FULL_48_27b]
MKQLVHNLQGWVVEPFGGKWMFVFVFSTFSLSVVADLGSTYSFLADCNWDLGCEGNTFSRMIFSRFGFLGGSMVIFASEVVGIFLIGLPLLCRKMRPMAKAIVRRITIISLLSIALDFSLNALENMHFIPHTYLPSGFLFHTSDSDTPLIFMEAGIFLAVPLLAYFLALLVFRALSILLAKATGARAKPPLNI